MSTDSLFPLKNGIGKETINYIQATRQLFTSELMNNFEISFRCKMGHFYAFIGSVGMHNGDILSVRPNIHFQTSARIFTKFHTLNPPLKSVQLI